MVTTTQNSGLTGIDKRSTELLNKTKGKKTTKTIIAEFFGLDERLVYNDDGTSVVDLINDFKDLKILAKKGVRYLHRLSELGISEEVFKGYFSNGLPTQEQIEAETNIASKKKDTETVALEAKVRAGLEQEWGEKLKAIKEENEEKETKLKTDLEAKVRAELEAEYKTKYEAELKKLTDNKKTDAKSNGTNSGGGDSMSNETEKK